MKGLLTLRLDLIDWIIITWYISKLYKYIKFYGLLISITLLLITRLIKNMTKIVVPNSLEKKISISTKKNVIYIYIFYRTLLFKNIYISLFDL